MFQVVHVNFGTRFENRFDTFEAAVEFAKSKGFEAAILYTRNGCSGLIGTWSPITGAHKW